MSAGIAKTSQGKHNKPPRAACLCASSLVVVSPHFCTHTRTPPSQTLPSRPQFTRSYHSAVGFDRQLAVFGGFTRLDVNQDGQSTGYVYNDLLAGATYKEATDGWQLAAFNQDCSGCVPSVRYDHRAVALNGTMLVFGGRFESLQPGLWSLHLPAVNVWRQARASDFAAGQTVGSLLTSAHFMIAIVALLVMCFCVFVVSLRRSSRRRYEVW